MATIEKIRKQRGLVIILIGLGMLGFLIPYDAVMAMLGVGQNKAIGEAAGFSISAVEYQEAVRSRDQLLNYNNRQSLESEVWEDLLQNALLEPQFNAVGVGISEEEYEEIVYGDYLSTFVKSTFYGTGITPEAKQNWRNQFENWRDGAPDIYRGYEKVIGAKRKKEKWDNLISKGAYVSDLEAKYDYQQKQDKITFDFVVVGYDEVNDSLISWSESDVKAYYRKHKNENKYAQNTERDVEYIEFEVKASEADKFAIGDGLSKIKEDWTKAANDSLFCVANNANPRYVTVNYKDGDFEGPENEQFLNDSVGAIVGPYEQNNLIRLAKIIDRKESPDSVECRHILLKAATPEEFITAQIKSDSIQKEIEAGRASFEDMVTQFSEDPGSVEKGGKYEWFARGRMVPEFEAAAFDNPVGTLLSAKTTYGIHLIEVLDHKDLGTLVTLAMIDRQIKPSVETINGAYANANEFSIMHSDAESFTNAADTMGYAIQVANAIKPGDVRVGTLTTASDVTRWAYQAEKDEISYPIKVGDKYIIARLLKVKEQGAPPFENVRDEMELEVIKEKKAEYLVSKMETGLNLQEVADATGTKVKKANKVNWSRTNVPGAGNSEREPKVLGLAFGIPVGEMSYPVIGNGGVYVIAPTEAPEIAEGKDNYIEEQDALIRNAQSKSISPTLGYYGAIRNSANVVDKRFEY